MKKGEKIISCLPIPTQPPLYLHCHPLLATCSLSSNTSVHLTHFSMAHSLSISSSFSLTHFFLPTISSFSSSCSFSSSSSYFNHFLPFFSIYSGPLLTHDCLPTSLLCWQAGCCATLATYLPRSNKSVQAQHNHSIST